MRRLSRGLESRAAGLQARARSLGAPARQERRPPLARCGHSRITAPVRLLCTRALCGEEVGQGEPATLAPSLLPRASPGAELTEQEGGRLAAQAWGPGGWAPSEALQHPPLLCWP